MDKEISLILAPAPAKASKFPKTARLLKSNQYKHLQRNSNRIFGDSIIIQFHLGRSSTAKLGITVSKKFGKAHTRNRFKRILREAFRELYTTLPTNLEMNVTPQKAAESLSKQALVIELKDILNKILK